MDHQRHPLRSEVLGNGSGISSIFFFKFSSSSEPTRSVPAEAFGFVPCLSLRASELYFNQGAL